MKSLIARPPYFASVLTVSAAAVLAAFQLNTLDFVIISGLEILSFLLLRRIELRFSTKTIELLNSTNQTRLLIEYLGIPQRRAFSLALLGLVRDIPALLYLVTLSHQASSLILGLVWTTLSVLLNTALYCTRYNETRQYLTRIIQDAHAKMDLSNAVMRLKFDPKHNSPHSRPYLNLVILMGFMLLLPLYALPHFRERFEMLDLFLILTPGMLIFLNLWNQNREFTSESFRTMASALSGFDLEKKEIRLELSCSENSLRLAQAFYLMQRRVSCAESEITKILIEESDKRRFQFLGEIAGLVAHDLSGPLHAAHFYSEELLENPNHPKKDEFIKKLSKNIRRSTEMIISLKGRLKNPIKEGVFCSLREVQKEVLKFLEIKAHEEAFSKILFYTNLDDSSDLWVRLPQADVTHILDNLYQNSVNNLTQNSVQNPSIELKVIRGSDDPRFCILSLKDNGTGLSSSRFESLTSFSVSHGGLGLRLTRRLIEHHGGTLSVNENCETGTEFYLKLPIYYPVSLSSAPPLSPENDHLKGSTPYV